MYCLNFVCMWEKVYRRRFFDSGMKRLAIRMMIIVMENSFPAQEENPLIFYSMILVYPPPFPGWLLRARILCNYLYSAEVKSVLKFCYIGWSCTQMRRWHLIDPLILRLQEISISISKDVTGRVCILCSRKFELWGTRIKARGLEVPPHGAEWRKESVCQPYPSSPCNTPLLRKEESLPKAGLNRSLALYPLHIYIPSDNAKPLIRWWWQGHGRVSLALGSNTSLWSAGISHRQRRWGWWGDPTRVLLHTAGAWRPPASFPVAPAYILVLPLLSTEGLCPTCPPLITLLSITISIMVVFRSPSWTRVPLCQTSARHRTIIIQSDLLNNRGHTTSYGLLKSVESDSIDLSEFLIGP